MSGANRSGLWGIACLLIFALPTLALSQDSGRLVNAPRFYVASAYPMSGPVPVDPMLVAAFRKRITLRLSAVPGRMAIGEIGRLAGLEFVYANDVLPVDVTITLRAEEITVAAALTDILLDLNVDVVMGSEGNVILTKRIAPTVVQVSADTIRGRVTSDSGAAIIGAQVLVTMAPERIVESTQSDLDGRYVIVFTNGTGDYLVHISAVGRTSFRKRATRLGSQIVFVIDAILKSASTKIAAVNVIAEKPKPSRDPDPGGDVGGTESPTLGFFAALPPAQAADLSTLAATVPGIVATTDGISVLGLGASQNNITIGGMSFAGATVPRSVQSTVRVSTTKYDPASGWFSGANTNVEISRSSVYSGREAYITVDAPPLQFTDPISARLGQRFTNLLADIGLIGPVSKADRWLYRVGARASHRTSDAVSLFDADPELLRHAGIAPDSVGRLRQILATKSVPAWLRLNAGPMVTDKVVLLGRIDRADVDWKTYQPLRSTVGLSTYASWSHSGPLGLSPTSAPTFSGERRDVTGRLEGLYSRYWSEHDFLTDVKSSVTLSVITGTPAARLPGGNVFVTSDFADTTNASSNVQFGGNPSVARDYRQWTWETMSATQFYTPGSAVHRVKLTADARLDRVSQHDPVNAFGTFAFNSLADLAANQPLSFSRTLNSPSGQGAEWNAFLAVGDLWRASQKFQMQYGVRIEGNRFTTVPAFNPAVERAFSTRTDVVPNTFAVLPRLGFTWVHTGSSAGNGLMFNKMGMFNVGPTSYLRGGFGAFRGMLPAGLISSALTTTGLLDGAQNITCVGAAVPTPDWSAFAANPENVPSRCAGGPSNDIFGTRAPNVQLFDRSFTAPLSWRGNLAWASQYHGMNYTVDVTYSLNQHQPGIVDLNFNNTPSFLLVDEGRPVFVPATAIASSSGAVSTVPSRRDTAFARVTSSRSDLRSVSRQVIVTVAPDLYRTEGWFTSLSYVHSDVRALQRGFDGTTFLSPLDDAWVRGDLDVRHTFQLQAGVEIGKVSFAMFGLLRSGRPFTPIVGTDINGDGMVNDRAFVFDPAHLADPALARGLRTLIAGSSSNVRRCLERQLGTAAGTNSCEGPWTTAMNATLSLDGSLFGSGKRLAWIHVNFTNVLGGIDQILHGSSRLHGWGTQPMPDPVLYNVRGFDPTSRRFAYAVNQRFGNTNPSQSTLRAPFMLTLDVRLYLGRDVMQQQVERFLRPGRSGFPGPRLTVDDLKRRYERNISDPYAEILAETDSLLLSPVQESALRQAQTKYRIRIDSVWTALGEYLVALGDEYDVAAATRRQNDAYDDGWDLSQADVQATLPSMLTLVQLRILPGMAHEYFHSKKKVRPPGRTLRP